jgi:hypothetical protein
MALQYNANLHLLHGLLPFICLFYLSFQFSILHLLISVCTQFYYLFFSCPLTQLPWGLLLHTQFTFLLLSNLLI